MKNIDYIRNLDDNEIVDWLARLLWCDECPLYLKCQNTDLECDDFIKQWLNEERK